MAGSQLTLPVLFLVMVMIIRSSGQDSKKEIFLRKRAVTWNEARIRCEWENKTLATVQNEEEQKALEKAISAEGGIPLFGGYWIAATNLGSPGKQYVWFGNKNKMVMYADWDKNQPDNFLRIENCVELWGKNAKWNDFPCENKVFYICEKEKAPTDQTENPPQNASVIDVRVKE